MAHLYHSYVEKPGNISLIHQIHQQQVSEICGRPPALRHSATASLSCSADPLRGFKEALIGWYLQHPSHRKIQHETGDPNLIGKSELHFGFDLIFGYWNLKNWKLCWFKHILIIHVHGYLQWKHKKNLAGSYRFPSELCQVVLSGTETEQFANWKIII